MVKYKKSKKIKKKQKGGFLPNYIVYKMQKWNEKRRKQKGGFRREAAAIAKRTNKKYKPSKFDNWLARTFS